MTSILNSQIPTIIKKSNELLAEEILTIHKFGQNRDKFLKVQKSPLYNGETDNEVTLHLYDEASGIGLEHSWFVPVDELKEVLERYYSDDFTMSSEKIEYSLQI